MEMKKVLVGSVLLALVYFNFSYAASLGPIRPLGNLKISVGVEDDYVFSRPIKAKVDVFGGKIKDSNSTFLLLGLGLTDYFNLYARAGAGNLSEKLNWSGGVVQTIDYNYGFIWGIGANGLYQLKNNFGIGLDAQFDMGYNKANSVSGTADPALYGGKGPITTYEAQVASYLTYDLKINENLKFMPYAGGYYSYYKIHKGIATVDSSSGFYTTEDEKVSNKNKWGALVGCEVAFLKQLSLKVEGRFIAETAISTSLNYKF